MVGSALNISRNSRTLCKLRVAMTMSIDPLYHKLARLITQLFICLGVGESTLCEIAFHLGDGKSLIFKFEGVARLLAYHMLSELRLEGKNVLLRFCIPRT